MEEHRLELGDVRFPFEVDASDTIQLSQSQIEEFADLADTEPDDIRKKIQDLDSFST